MQKSISAGPLRLSLYFNNGNRLCGVKLPGNPSPGLTRKHLFSVLDQLATFVAEPSIGTPFARAVWREVCEIAPGSTLSYGEIALRLGKSGAARAVGLACKSNPLLLAVPCHRVIAAQHIGGYAAGSAWKRLLIALEAEKAALHFALTGL